MPINLDQLNPVLPLSIASLLLLVTAIDAKRDRYRPLWLSLLLRIGVFAALTWLLQLALGSPVVPQFHTTLPGGQFWGQIVQIGWWMLGARVAVGLVRLVVVLENRPRETQIISDLLAGVIYIATALAVINFVFAVPIGGLVATSGVVAIVLGLALQSTLSDVFSGIAIGLEHAYKAGDLLSVEGGVEGQVLQINWRSTQIATAHNSIAIVPNSVMAKSRLENRSVPTPTCSASVNVTTEAGVDPRRPLAVLDAAVKGCRLPLSQPEPTINCIGIHGDGLLYEIDFSVDESTNVAPARTEMLSQIHRHLRHAGIALGIPGVASPPPVSVPTISELLKQSDVFGELAPDEQELLVGRFTACSLECGETLLQQGKEPEALFLMASGTAVQTNGAGSERRVLSYATPGDSVGMIALIIGGPSHVTATALTTLDTYRLNKVVLADVLRERPELATHLEALAKRGLAWLQCEAPAHIDAQIGKPEIFLSRVRQFLHRLTAQ
jgi:small-conductance mechanosensitive channel/CRP-like cAMP-binding protein